MALTPSQRLEALLDLCEAQPRSDLLGAEELWVPPNLCNDLKLQEVRARFGPKCPRLQYSTLYKRNEHAGNIFDLYWLQSHCITLFFTRQLAWIK